MMRVQNDAIEYSIIDDKTRKREATVCHSEMPDVDRILAWIEGIQADSENPTFPNLASLEFKAKTLKRRRMQQMPSPDAHSNMSSADIHDADDAADRDGRARKRIHIDDETPRPKQPRRRAVSPQSLSSASAWSQSQSSSRASPQKHFAALELSDRGISMRSLSLIPKYGNDDLRHMISGMRQVTHGAGILNMELKEQMEAHSNEEVAELGELDFLFAQEKPDIGAMPDVESVLGILAVAAECRDNLHPEANWNSMVHQELLRLALRSPQWPRVKKIVDYMPSSTATLIPEYLPPFSPSKKVDFSIYIEPSLDCESAAIQSRITEVRQSLHGNAINHTSFYPLRQRPIALSIETKKTGEGWDGATVQMGVWHSAHWTFLRELAGTAKVEPAADALPRFLPGIIVQGHDWNLVFTTQEGTQTILWTKLTIGSTSDVLGIYKIIYALRLLGQWAETKYWPYLREVLMPGTQTTEPNG